MAESSAQIEPEMPDNDDSTLLLPPLLSQLPSNSAPSLSSLSPIELELAMFKGIIAAGCSIKSQQRGEPDLTERELCEDLHTILCQKPGSFLMRFGKYLNESDLKFFERMSTGDYEVGFRVKELQQNLQRTSRARLKTIKNRRYVHLEQLMCGSDYFSDEEMQQRDPLLFEYYIGQFLSEEEKLQIGENKSEMKLSEMILKNIDVDQRTRLLMEQRSREQDQLEESDSSSDEDIADTTGSGSVTFAPMKLSLKPETAVREKLMLRREFLSVMQTSFLEGRDKDFDYPKVDQNEQYDSLEMRGRDIEDSYFDAEEPSWCELDAHSNSNGRMELSTSEGEVSTCTRHGMATESTDELRT